MGKKKKRLKLTLKTFFDDFDLVWAVYWNLSEHVLRSVAIRTLRTVRSYVAEQISRKVR